MQNQNIGKLIMREKKIDKAMSSEVICEKCGAMVPSDEYPAHALAHMKKTSEPGARKKPIFYCTICNKSYNSEFLHFLL